MNIRLEQGREVNSSVGTDVDGNPIEKHRWYVIVAPTRFSDDITVVSSSMSQEEANTRVNALEDAAHADRERARRLARRILQFRDDSERTGSTDPDRAHWLLAQTCAFLERIANVNLEATGR